MKHLIISFFLLCFCLSCDMILSGSYARAVWYELNVENDELIEKIKKFKKENPQYKILVSGVEREDWTDEYNFYHVSFFIKDENMNIYIVINLNGEEKQKKESVIGLTNILKDVKTKNAKFYQVHELPKETRNLVINIFQTEVLDNLGAWKRK